ncbi:MULTISPECIES: SusC/RagA family TonB-linked outer membrane protein [Butyricimonas]|uniref:SusC/RagA family TonB-linked outer membrane protein n=1 Tax=Butyricimonas hominis TaxID=2763032 RepID=A0ABR7D4Y1_9BACT|nr:MULTISPECIES: SusC/RagA family TonB-linked outer membrane protein [Butyricimonas]MBC5622849.1 SusC/RagA family TonB-linked outer membrane protein [Butyricimonas hominis]
MKKFEESGIYVARGCVLLLFLLFTTGVMAQHQKVTIDVRDVGVQEVFKSINKQTGLDFVYGALQLKELGTVTLQMRDVTVEEVMAKLFAGTQFEYKFEMKSIVIKKKEKRDEVRNRSLSGSVKDENGKPLPGVTVAVKGISLGTATDKDGKYKLVFPWVEKPVIVFSFIGMETLEVKYAGNDTINVVMKECVAELEEVLVQTGYQSIDPRKNTSAVTTIKAADIITPGLQTIDQMLEGYVPGMVFMQNTGQIGAAPRLRVRGTSTVLGSQEPLWVIDGIVQENPVNVDPSQINDLDFVNLLGNAISGLNPEDIEQIDVLKDASATAIYGARAGNGVIVITTKKGKAGPPSVSYSFSGTYTRRPYYTDRAVNVMNSEERIDFSRELIAKQTVYPTIKTWIGYEEAIRKYYRGEISFEKFQQDVGYYERVNTDWFDLLMQNSFSHKHTLSLSGGTDKTKYYASVGYSDMKGAERREKNKLYSVSLKVDVNYNRFDLHFDMKGNVGEKRYTPSDVGVTEYAYNTTRALPAYTESGDYWYYAREGSDNTGYYQLFNILKEVENSTQDIDSHGMTFTGTLGYRIMDPLKFALTLSYSVNNTEQDIWHGEDTYYCRKLRSNMPDGSENLNYNRLPVGGELQEKNTRRNAYTLRGQLNFNKYLDVARNHMIVAAVGGEMSSNKYKGLEQTYRGFLKERGLQMAEIDLKKYVKYAEWLQTAEAKGIRTDQLTNMISGYFTLSYSYKDYYTLNFNTRVDASNKFGSRANDKFLPIWSVSGRLNLKEAFMERANWVNTLALRASFGYQGNMLDSETVETVIKRGTHDKYFNEYASTIYKYPNPLLKWEKISSVNTTLDFAFLKNKIRGSVSYYYKKTRDAFLSKKVSEVNGIDAYVVNKGTLTNRGMELALNFIPVNTFGGGSKNGFRWSFDPQFGQVINKLLNKAINNGKKQSLRDEDNITYTDYLNGRVEVAGRPLNSFFSYRFAGLDPADGRPMFSGTEVNYTVNGEEVLGEDGEVITNKSRYAEMTKEQVFLEVMDYSGCRVPKLQGGVRNTFSYRGFALALNLSYSIGSKVRLLRMYPNIAKENGTLAPQPMENVRREFLRRWKSPGDEAYTNVPGIISDDEFVKSLSNGWWRKETYSFGTNIWQMYDYSDIRVVSGNYLKIQSVSLRYNVPTRWCNRLFLKSAYVSLSGTNLYTWGAKALKGQDPSTQTGSSTKIAQSVRPTYSFSLNVTF